MKYVYVTVMALALALVFSANYGTAVAGKARVVSSPKKQQVVNVQAQIAAARAAAEAAARARASKKR